MGKPFRDMTLEEKELDKQRKKRYRDKNPEKYRSAALEYYYANKEKCAEKARKWRLDNLDYIKEKQRADNRKRKLWAISYLGGCCTTCKQDFHPSVYEFHHKDPTTKDRDPSKMMSLSKVKLQNELDKCVLLCANCHRIEHHGDSY